MHCNVASLVNLHICIILVGLCSASVFAQLADTMVCADESCTETISQGEARLAYRPRDDKFLSLKKGDVVLVKSKNAGKKSHIWGGQEFLKDKSQSSTEDLYSGLVAKNQKITIDKTKKDKVDREGSKEDNIDEKLKEEPPDTSEQPSNHENSRGSESSESEELKIANGDSGSANNEEEPDPLGDGSHQDGGDGRLEQPAVDQQEQNGGIGFAPGHKETPQEENHAHNHEEPAEADMADQRKETGMQSEENQAEQASKNIHPTDHTQNHPEVPAEELKESDNKDDGQAADLSDRHVGEFDQKLGVEDSMKRDVPTAPEEQTSAELDDLGTTYDKEKNILDTASMPPDIAVLLGQEHIDPRVPHTQQGEDEKAPEETLRDNELEENVVDPGAAKVKDDGASTVHDRPHNEQSTHQDHSEGIVRAERENESDTETVGAIHQTDFSIPDGEAFAADTIPDDEKALTDHTQQMEGSIPTMKNISNDSPVRPQNGSVPEVTSGQVDINHPDLDASTEGKGDQVGNRDDQDKPQVEAEFSAVNDHGDVQDSAERTVHLAQENGLELGRDSTAAETASPDTLKMDQHVDKPGAGEVDPRSLGDKNRENGDGTDENLQDMAKKSPRETIVQEDDQDSFEDDGGPFEEYDDFEEDGGEFDDAEVEEETIDLDERQEIRKTDEQHAGTGDDFNDNQGPEDQNIGKGTGHTSEEKNYVHQEMEHSMQHEESYTHEAQNGEKQSEISSTKSKDDQESHAATPEDIADIENLSEYQEGRAEVETPAVSDPGMKSPIHPAEGQHQSPDGDLGVAHPAEGNSQEENALPGHLTKSETDESTEHSEIQHEKEKSMEPAAEHNREVVNNVTHEGNSGEEENMEGQEAESDDHSAQKRVEGMPETPHYQHEVPSNGGIPKQAETELVGDDIGKQTREHDQEAELKNPVSVSDEDQVDSILDKSHQNNQYLKTGGREQATASDEDKINLGYDESDSDMHGDQNVEKDLKAESVKQSPAFDEGKKNPSDDEFHHKSGGEESTQKTEAQEEVLVLEEDKVDPTLDKSRQKNDKDENIQKTEGQEQAPALNEGENDLTFDNESHQKIDGDVSIKKTEGQARALDEGEDDSSFDESRQKSDESGNRKETEGLKQALVLGEGKDDPTYDESHQKSDGDENDKKTEGQGHTSDDGKVDSTYDESHQKSDGEENILQTESQEQERALNAGTQDPTDDESRLKTNESPSTPEEGSKSQEKVNGKKVLDSTETQEENQGQKKNDRESSETAGSGREVAQSRESSDANRVADADDEQGNNTESSHDHDYASQLSDSVLQMDGAAKSVSHPSAQEAITDTEEGDTEKYNVLHEGQVVNWDETIEGKPKDENSKGWDETLGNDDEDIQVVHPPTTVSPPGDQQNENVAETVHEVPQTTEEPLPVPPDEDITEPPPEMPSTKAVAPEHPAKPLLEDENLTTTAEAGATQHGQADSEQQESQKPHRDQSNQESFNSNAQTQRQEDNEDTEDSVERDVPTSEEELHAESFWLRLLIALSNVPYDVKYILDPVFSVWALLLPEEYQNDVYGVSWPIILFTFFIGFTLICLLTCRSRSLKKRQREERSQRTIQELKALLENVSQEKIDAENELRIKENEIEIHNEQMATATREKQMVVTEKMGLEQSIQQYNAENEALKLEMQRLGQSNEEKDRAMQEILSNSKQVEKSLLAQQEAIKAYETEISQLRKSVTKHETGQKEAESSSDKLKERVKNLEKTKGETKKEGKVLREQIDKLNATIGELQGRLDEQIDKGEQKSQEIDVLKDCILQFKGAQEYLDDEDGDAESEESVEKQKEKMRSMVDVANVKALLRQSEAEKLRMSYELEAERKSVLDVETKISHLETTIQGDKAVKDKLERDKQMLESKLAVMQDFYAKREVEIQTKLGLEQSKRESNASMLEDKQKQEMDMLEQLEVYKKMSEEAKHNYEDAERKHKQEMMGFEKKAHDNWLACREAERKFEEANKQINMLQLELGDTRMRLRDSERDPILRPRLDRHGPPGGPPPFGPPPRHSPLHFRGGPPDVDRRSPPPPQKRPPSPGGSIPGDRPPSRPDRPPSAHSLPPMDRRPPGPGHPYPGAYGRDGRPYRDGMPPDGRPPPFRDGMPPDGRPPHFRDGMPPMRPPLRGLPPHARPPPPSGPGPRNPPSGPMTSSPYMDRPPIPSSEESPGQRSQNFTQSTLHATPPHHPHREGLRNDGHQPSPHPDPATAGPPPPGRSRDADGANPFRRSRP